MKPLDIVRVVAFCDLVRVYPESLPDEQTAKALHRLRAAKQELGLEGESVCQFATRQMREGRGINRHA